MHKILGFLIVFATALPQAHAQNYSAKQAGRQMSERELSENMEIIERDINENGELIEQNDEQINSVYDILQDKYREAGHEPPNRQNFLPEE